MTESMRVLIIIPLVTDFVMDKLVTKFMSQFRLPKAQSIALPILEEILL